MVRLLDLSIDILYIIISHLQSDKNSLRNLALVCRVFRNEAQRYLVRDITIAVAWKPLDHSLIRTLTERSDLIPYVHQLAIKIPAEDFDSPALDALSVLINRMTRLGELCYIQDSVHQSWYGEYLPLPLELMPKWANDRVTRIDWNYTTIPVDTLRLCMSLPRIKSIWCLLHEFRARQSGILDKTSPLTELRLGVSLGPPVEDIRLTLSMPQRLQKVILESIDGFLAGHRMDSLMSILEPVRETLQELRVCLKGP